MKREVKQWIGVALVSGFWIGVMELMQTLC